MLLWKTKHCLNARFWLCKYSLLMLCVTVIGKGACEDKLLPLHYNSLASEVLADISVLCQTCWMLLLLLYSNLKQTNKKLCWKLKGPEFWSFILISSVHICHMKLVYSLSWGCICGDPMNIWLWVTNVLSNESSEFNQNKLNLFFVWLESEKYFALRAISGKQ